MKNKTIVAFSLMFAIAFAFSVVANAQTTTVATTTTTTSASTTLAVPTVTSVTPVTTVTSPGLPNTGAGGEAALNLAILLASGAVAAVAGVYAYRGFANAR